MSEQFDKKDPGAGEAAAEDQGNRSSDQSYIWGGSFASLKLEEVLWLKPKGWFHTQTQNGQTTISVYRPDEPDQIITCLSVGHANRVRQALTDMGMTGYIDGGSTWPNP